MSEFNYKIRKWSDDAATKFADKIKTLKPGKEDNFISREVIYPFHRNADEAYSGSIMIWQNENKSYTIGFFFGYYCGDVFFERATDVKERDVDKLPALIENIHKTYCNEKMIDEIIRDEKKETGFTPLKDGKKQVIQTALREAKDFAKALRRYLYDISQERQFTEEEQELWNATHDVHVHTIDAYLLLDELLD